MRALLIERFSNPYTDHRTGGLRERQPEVTGSAQPGNVWRWAWLAGCAHLEDVDGG